jgi:hypothetical protein
MTKSSSLESVLSVLSSLSYRGKIWLYQKKRVVGSKKPRYRVSPKKRKREKNYIRARHVKAEQPERV